jgi:hypothetical protein
MQGSSQHGCVKVSLLSLPTSSHGSTETSSASSSQVHVDSDLQRSLLGLASCRVGSVCAVSTVSSVAEPGTEAKCSEATSRQQDPLSLNFKLLASGLQYEDSLGATHDPVTYSRNTLDENALSLAISRLITKQSSTLEKMKRFQEESAVKRSSVMTSFHVLREAVASCERSALVAFDEEVRVQVKQLELEAEGLEVLSQQLSAKAVCSDYSHAEVTTLDGDTAIDSEVVSVRSVGVALCCDMLKSMLVDCWKLVHCCTEDSDEFALKAASARLEICAKVCPF